MYLKEYTDTRFGEDDPIRLIPIETESDMWVISNPKTFKSNARFVMHKVGRSWTLVIIDNKQRHIRTGGVGLWLVMRGDKARFDTIHKIRTYYPDVYAQYHREP